MEKTYSSPQQYSEVCFSNEMTKSRCAFLWQVKLLSTKSIKKIPSSISPFLITLQISISILKKIKTSLRHIFSYSFRLRVYKKKTFRSCILEFLPILHFPGDSLQNLLVHFRIILRYSIQSSNSFCFC